MGGKPLLPASTHAEVIAGPMRRCGISCRCLIVDLHRATAGNLIGNRCRRVMIQKGKRVG